MKIFCRYLAFVVIILSQWLTATAIASNLPDLGNEFRSAISISDERLMGDLMMREIRAAGLAHPDALVNEYIRHVGNRLTPYMSMPYNDLHIKFFAIKDDSINAFAFFGGHVAVHSGLIMVTNTESELAGVMAHELAHVSQQHLLQQITESKRAMPVTLAESLVAIALGVPELIIPALAGQAQQMLNFSRQYEHEADRIGVQILAKAQFDPQGLPNMLERMEHQLRYNNKPPEYLLTHPLSESRIADTRNRANELHYKRKSNSNMFHLVKARINVQSASNLNHFIEESEHTLNTQRYSNKLAAHYAHAYALLLNDKPEQAWDALDSLITAYPDDLIIQLTAVDIEMQMHRTTQAKQRIQHLLQVYPDSAAVLLQYADLLLQAKDPKQAKKILAKYKQLHTPEPMYYEYVRQSEGMLGNQVAVYEANAEWYLLHGDFGSAITQLSTGLENIKNDQKTKTRIEARIEEVQELIQRVKKV